MKQLALELSASAAPAFDNFVIGANAEVASALESVARGAHTERFVYLWGVPGSGRGHLLAAAAAASVRRPSAFVRAPFAAESFDEVAPDGLLAVADVERLDASGQRRLFGLYNRLRAGAGALVASGPAAPGGLAVRADLATRLAWGLVYEVRALGDDEKTVAMRSRARDRGFELPAEVSDYVLRHWRRDLASLLAFIDLLDRRSLETRRAITLKLAREVIEHVTGEAGAH